MSEICAQHVRCEALLERITALENSLSILGFALRSTTTFEQAREVGAKIALDQQKLSAALQEKNYINFCPGCPFAAKSESKTGLWWRQEPD